MHIDLITLLSRQKHASLFVRSINDGERSLVTPTDYLNSHDVTTFCWFNTFFNFYFSGLYYKHVTIVIYNYSNSSLYYLYVTIVIYDPGNSFLYCKCLVIVNYPSCSKALALPRSVNYNFKVHCTFRIESYDCNMFIVQVIGVNFGDLFFLYLLRLMKIS
jgi:hypothetical protein